MEMYEMMILNLTSLFVFFELLNKSSVICAAEVNVLQ